MEREVCCPVADSFLKKNVNLEGIVVVLFLVSFPALALACASLISFSLFLPASVMKGEGNSK